MFSFSDSDILSQLEKPGNNGSGLIERNVKVAAWFYMHAILDEVASKREGRSIYIDVPYVAKRVMGDKDYVSGPMKIKDAADFPNEFAAFQGWMKNQKTNVKSLPRVTPAAFRTCEELEITTIEDLAAAENVPPELIAHQEMARRWLSLANPEAEKKARAPYGSKKKAHAQDAKAVA